MMKVQDLGGDLNKYLQDYHYQPDLTRYLDRLAGTQFTQATINEIVLWKVDRFVSLSDSTLAGVNWVKELEPGYHREAEVVLGTLIRAKGVDVPMASAILRFQNPSVFQIIDRHAYRAVYGEDYPLYSSSRLEKKVSLYFDYLDELRRLCDERGFDFETIDRLLYEFDKQVNGKL